MSKEAVGIPVDSHATMESAMLDTRTTPTPPLHDAIIKPQYRHPFWGLLGSFDVTHQWKANRAFRLQVTLIAG
jgi:hypothetical protein